MRLSQAPTAKVSRRRRRHFACRLIDHCAVSRFTTASGAVRAHMWDDIMALAQVTKYPVECERYRGEVRGNRCGVA